MIGETNINGGAGLNGNGALLKIKAETGSTITVSKGSYSKIIKVSQLDPDNNYWSYWFFQTNDYGEWTVTATLETETATQTASDTVTITTKGQVETILLQYIMDLVRNGDVITELVATHGSVTKSGNAAKWSIGTHVSLLKANIDVTHFNKIVLEVSAGASWHGGQAPGVGCSNTNVTISSSSGAVSQYYAFDFLNSREGSIPARTHEVDISNVEGEKTIWISLSYSNVTQSPYVNILNWYLEG